MHEALNEADIEIHWDCAVETVKSTAEGVHVETSDGWE